MEDSIPSPAWNFTVRNRSKSKDISDAKPKVFQISWPDIYALRKSIWFASYMACIEEVHSIWTQTSMIS